MDNSLIPLILGMAAVTYGPRLAPFLFFGRIKVSCRVDAFLKAIPAAAIGALILPGIFSATPDFPAAGLCGMGFACLYGLFRGGIIVPVLGAVGVAFMVLSGWSG